MKNAFLIVVSLMTLVLFAACKESVLYPDGVPQGEAPVAPGAPAPQNQGSWVTAPMTLTLAEDNPAEAFESLFPANSTEFSPGGLRADSEERQSTKMLGARLHLRPAEGDCSNRPTCKVRGELEIVHATSDFKSLVYSRSFAPPSDQDLATLQLKVSGKDRIQKMILTDAQGLMLEVEIERKAAQSAADVAALEWTGRLLLIEASGSRRELGKLQGLDWVP